MTLEQQIEALAQLGLPLNEGITIDDLLYSASRETYEQEPFDYLLFMFGSEVERAPWCRPICPYAWNLDTECISGTGDYVEIVKRLCQIAKMPDLITDLQDFVDLDRPQGWLKYRIDGQQRHYDIEIDSDWADPQVIGDVMRDIERDGNRFYAKDNGQASIWFYLDETTMQKLNQLSNNALVLGNP
jgi:hypothetical protein